MHSSAAQREVNALAVEKIILRGEEKEILSIRRTVLQSQTIFCLELTRLEFLRCGCRTPVVFRGADFRLFSTLVKPQTPHHCHLDRSPRVFREDAVERSWCDQCIEVVAILMRTYYVLDQAADAAVLFECAVDGTSSPSQRTLTSLDTPGSCMVTP